VAEVCALSNFDVHVDVENGGAVGGRHAVLLFFTPPSAGKNGAPVKELAAFDSVFVEAGRRQRVVLGLNPCRHLGTVREDGTRVVEAGQHLLSVGDASHSLAVLSSLDDADLSTDSATSGN
jgi:beta-D-xylosidase 4